MDYKAIAETLKQVGFTGFASLEQDKYPGDMKETCRRYLRLMRECLGQA
jgi:sugar phosphate isomerase/epimerase